MKKLTVISGKGGTGKTTVTANLGALAQDLVLADCDVDAPNLHLLMNPLVESEEDYQGAKLAIKDDKKCIDCGKCYQLCEFNAITEKYEVDELKCEGCGLCVAMCPTDALRLEKQITGKLYYSQSAVGTMVHAKLKIGAENSGKLVSEVKEKAEILAQEEEKELVLIDGSPGIGCPVIASLNGVDGALVVTEPTQSGLADLKRVLKVIEHFSISAMVVINKVDLNLDLSQEIANFCQNKDVEVVGEIPFSDIVVEAMRQGELVVDYAADSKAAAAMRDIWEEVKEQLAIKSNKVISKE
ncbi:MAG: ATP-binding protein [Bacillota bacterium]